MASLAKGPFRASATGEGRIANHTLATPPSTAIPSSFACHRDHHFTPVTHKMAGINEYGVDVGFSFQRRTAGRAHPLEASEKNYQQNKLRSELNLLRNTQGLHAPLKISMEVQAAEKVGRLPFLSSSNFMKDVLLGHHERISFEDFLSPPEFREQVAQPHAVMEKSFGVL